MRTLSTTEPLLAIARIGQRVTAIVSFYRPSNGVPAHGRARLRGFEVDNELDLRDLLHRQLGRMLPFEDATVETPTKRLPPVRATVAMVTCPTYFWSQVVSGK